MFSRAEVSEVLDDMETMTETDYSVSVLTQELKGIKRS